jgi:predicted RNA-binding Zn-ribbon protein involved in translation (DUF1610 family)
LNSGRGNDEDKAPKSFEDPGRDCTVCGRYLERRFGGVKTMLLCQSCGGEVGRTAGEIEPDLLIEELRKFEHDHGLDPRTVLIVCPRCGERSKLSIKRAPEL